MPPRTPLALGVLLTLCLSIALARGVARAEPGRHAYALVVGSNDGGEGQGRLAFAERDAERMAALLGELGRIPKANIALLTEPKARDIEGALEQLRAKLADHAQAGERAQLLFYYSGHARAQALSLGKEELPLASLRASLLSLPSTLTVVVLDACQSGAFSGVKGAAPAADFSVSSVEQLNSSGIAVMASSTGTELSQESRALGSSYFTHHLLVSLRGAGDLDQNGKVSLDEAYGYAYQHTLSDTARTQVGSQHATLEVDLTGRGDVPLSYPVDADAQLSLSADVAGRVIVQRADAGAVVAELIKARGAALLLALPSGGYEVLVREAARARTCKVSLTKGAVHALSLAQCEAVTLPRERAKADLDAVHRDNRDARESFFLELGVGIMLAQPTTAYVRTLREFGHDLPRSGSFGPDMALGIGLGRYVSLLARYDLVEWRRTRELTQSSVTSLAWTTQTLMAGARFKLPLAGRWLVAFAELDVGASFVHSWVRARRFHAAGGWSSPVTDTYDRALAMRALGGFQVAFSRHFGMYLAAGYTRAPAMENELGQRHDSGGLTLVHGLRLNGVKGWW